MVIPLCVEELFVFTILFENPRRLVPRNVFFSVISGIRLTLLTQPNDTCLRRILTSVRLSEPVVLGDVHIDLLVFLTVHVLALSFNSIQVALVGFKGAAVVRPITITASNKHMWALVPQMILKFNGAVEFLLAIHAAPVLPTFPQMVLQVLSVHLDELFGGLVGEGVVIEEGLV